MSWGTRILILILVVVGAVGYLLWSHRAEIAAGPEAPPAQAAATDAPPTTPDREQP